MRADPIGPAESVFRTETRVATTDPVERWKFRRYWSVFSPGIVLIRQVSLWLVKERAERRAHETREQRMDKPSRNLVIIRGGTLCHTRSTNKVLPPSRQDEYANPEHDSLWLEEIFL